MIFFPKPQKGKFKERIGPLKSLTRKKNAIKKKVRWINEGDINSKLFSRVVNGRWKKFSSRKLCTTATRWFKRMMRLGERSLLLTGICIQKRHLLDRPFIDGTEWKPIDKPLTDCNGYRNLSRLRKSDKLFLSLIGKKSPYGLHWNFFKEVGR